MVPDLAVEEDRRWMQRALALAAQSVGLASPNPAVGCVLIKNDEIVGEGFHEYDKLDHAEIVALKQAADQAKGATAYVTLEPCSHYGRTGPCADALIRGGVARLVIATQDPNLIVHGRGIEKLLQAGIEVQTGTLQSVARELNDGFARFTRSSLPFVTMKVASSLDGRIAPAPGYDESRWITGDLAREEVHRMRHSSDALLTGIGTILADDPQLTDRSGLPRRRPLLRVVLDANLRTPIDSRLVRSVRSSQSSQEDILIFYVEGSSVARRALEARGVRLELLQPSPENAIAVPRVSLAAVIRRLGELACTNVLVEGGTALNTTVLDEAIADKLTLFYAPVFLGPDAVPMLSSSRGRGIERGAMPQRFTLRKFGDDFAFDAYLRDPWAGVS